MKGGLKMDKTNTMDKLRELEEKGKPLMELLKKHWNKQKIIIITHETIRLYDCEMMLHKTE
jgi:ABC-type transport system involved in cytochrome bd biosynthesis fused ATPase/permease subunit